MKPINNIENKQEYKRMKLVYKTGMVTGLLLTSLSAISGDNCTPNNSTAFTDFKDRVYRINHDAMANNTLISQCSNLTDEILLSNMNNCAPTPINPISGLGLNPSDKLLYGMSATDALGIGTHLEIGIPIDDIMKADDVNLYRIGNDGGFQNIGHIVPPEETIGLPPGTNQVVPIVHSAASFNEAGDLFVLAYRTNYTSSTNIMAGTAEVLYQAPQIVIGQISNNDLLNATVGPITTNWVDIDDTSDATCAAVVNKFKDDTNVFSVCMVDQYLMTGNEDAALQTCLASVPIIDKGVHDFAVSPVNGHFYAYDSMTYDDKDVLIDVDPMTNTAACTELPDAGNSTGVLSSLMFSSQNKLVAIFANQSVGNWIDISNGTINPIATAITPSPFGDGSSIPFASITRASNGEDDLIFMDGFEGIIDLIFANGFEGDIPPPTCPVF